MTAYGFGVDGGGTRSRLCVFDALSGEEVCRREGGSTNMYSVGRDAAAANLEALIRSAGIAPESFVTGCAGSAGLSREPEIAFFREKLGTFLPNCRLHLCNDGEILLVGTLRAPDGYALIAGTGSLALGRTADGRTVRAGGLGYMLGDEGSGLWIAWQALRRSLRSAEGRDLPTCLLPELTEFFGLRAPEEFVPLMHQHFEKSRIAAAAPLVLAHAEDDPLAGDIALRAAQELAALLKSVRSRLPDAAPRAAVSGGVTEHSPLIRGHLNEAVRTCMPDMELVFSMGDALVGAKLLAEQLMNI